MFNKNKLTITLLSLIFALSLFLRLFQLSSFPVGFHFDEASKGYSAYSLLKTGKDDNSHSFPLYIDIFGDNSPAGYHYTAIPSVAALGLTEFAVRLPGALFGAVSVFAIFFLSLALFQDKKIAVLSALLLSISPWHINLSRASSESLVALFFIMLGFAFVIWSIKTQKIKQILIGTALLAVSFFFYQTPRLFVPSLFFAIGFFLIFVWKINLKNNFKKIFIASFLFLVALDFFLIFIISGGVSRFSQVSIFNYPETTLVLQEQIREEGVSNIHPLFTRILHNKVINFSLAYISNYFEYFSWNFLFIKNLPQIYFVPSMGVLYLVQLPFVVYGLLLLAFHKTKTHKISLLWLILAPLAAAITAMDVNNLQRAMVLFPMLEIIGAFGIVHFVTNTKYKRVAIFIVAGLFIFNFVYFLNQYFIHTKVHRPWYRNNGFPKMMELVQKEAPFYDHIVTTKTQGGYPLFQFYTKYNPETYQKEGSPKDPDYKGFGKFIFTSDPCPFSSKDKLIPKKGKTIFIEESVCKETPLLQTVPFTYISREDGTKIFRVVFVKDDKIFE